MSDSNPTSCKAKDVKSYFDIPYFLMVFYLAKCLTEFYWLPNLTKIR